MARFHKVYTALGARRLLLFSTTTCVALAFVAGYRSAFFFRPKTQVAAAILVPPNAAPPAGLAGSETKADAGGSELARVPLQAGDTAKRIGPPLALAGVLLLGVGGIAWLAVALLGGGGSDGPDGKNGGPAGSGPQAARPILFVLPPKQFGDGVGGGELEFRNPLELFETAANRGGRIKQLDLNIVIAAPALQEEAWLLPTDPARWLLQSPKSRSKNPTGR